VELNTWDVGLVGLVPCGSGEGANIGNAISNRGILLVSTNAVVLNLGAECRGNLVVESGDAVRKIREGTKVTEVDLTRCNLVVRIERIAVIVGEIARISIGNELRRLKINMTAHHIAISTIRRSEEKLGDTALTSHIGVWRGLAKSVEVTSNNREDREISKRVDSHLNILTEDVAGNSEI